MDFHDVVVGRRSIRKYKDKEISVVDLNEILEAGIAAPNGMNLQPWYFVMVKDKEKLNQGKALMGKVYDRFKPVLEERFSRNPSIVKETGDFLTTLGGAPALLLAFASRPDYNDSVVVISGISAALENMLLAAFNKGIGSCWITAPIVTKMGRDFEELFAPDKGQLIACATFGYPDECPAMPPRRVGKYEIL